MNAHEIALAASLLLEIIGPRSRAIVQTRCIEILDNRHLDSLHHDAAALITLLTLHQEATTSTPNSNEIPN